jgi:hypothetical protein
MDTIPDPDLISPRKPADEHRVASTLTEIPRRRRNEPSWRRRAVGEMLRVCVLCNEVAEVLVIDGAPFCLDHVGHGWVAQARGRAIIGDRDPDDAERRVVEALRRARDAFQPGRRYWR